MAEKKKEKGLKKEKAVKKKVGKPKVEKKERKVEKKEVKKKDVEGKGKKEVKKKERKVLKKPKADKKLRAAIKRKVNLPSFVGRFGKKYKQKNKKKWMKWRKPRGIDIKRKKEYGHSPKTGYKTKREVRGLHPLGFKEVLVHGLGDVGKTGEGSVVRISSTLGKRKRIEIIKKLDEKKVWVLNR